MQLAPSLFSASAYHAAYYPPPPAPQDTHLKRQYLALLPPQQIIEICLTFDLHVPHYIKSTVWPADINAAIANLQNQNRNVPVVSNESNNSAKGESQPAGIDSLKPSPEKDSTPPPRTDLPPTDPQPPDKRASATAVPSSTSVPLASTPSSPTPGQHVASAEPSQPPQPQPAAAPSASTPTSGAPTAPTPYVHQPYSFPHPHATYPHAPYYPPPPAGYSYPYGSYATSIQNGYRHPAVPSTYSSQQTLYSNPYSISHPGPSQDVGGDDLPSYEEMIVEALTENPDPEGCAPKDLFTWMASKYPLQSNFRPSASQALQKAYKRGRFEKGTNGKYRLNATWEGGNTSRRTTRRPQIQGLGPSTPAPPASPFTHAPLVHHHGHTPAASQRGQSYPQPFGYSYAGYPGYPTQGPPASTAASTTTTTAVPSSTKLPVAGTAGSVGEADTYEAAKAILNAINSGNLLQLPQEEPLKDNSGTEMVGNGVEHLLSQLQSALASTAAAARAPPQPAPALVPQPSPAPNLRSEPRAELQAQLALLAAQLAELSQAEDTLTEYNPSPAIPPTFPTVQPEPIVQPPPAMATATPVGAQSVSHIPPMQGLLPPPQPQEEEDSDDDDMEAII